ncbi:MAG: hypothetical protein MHM6MM_005766 [Cercozoa sp. M6MM]
MNSRPRQILGERSEQRVSLAAAPLKPSAVVGDAVEKPSQNSGDNVSTQKDTRPNNDHTSDKDVAEISAQAKNETKGSAKDESAPKKRVQLRAAPVIDTRRLDTRAVSAPTTAIVENSLRVRGPRVPLAQLQKAQRETQSAQATARTAQRLLQRERALARQLTKQNDELQGVKQELELERSFHKQTLLLKTVAESDTAFAHEQLRLLQEQTEHERPAKRRRLRRQS